MSIRRRVLHGMSSNVLTQAVNVIIQLAGVPLLLKYWGVNYYGEWLVLFTIPGYIEISDFGLGTSATAEMIMLKEAGKDERVRMILKNTFWFILIMGGLPFILLYSSSWVIPWHSLLNFDAITQSEFNVAFLLLILYVYLSLFLTLPLGYYRIEKMYHRERYISIFFRILEFTALVIVVTNGHGIVWVAGAYLIVKCLYFIVVMSDLHRQYPQFRVTPWGFDVRKIKYLFKPSAAIMVIYFGQNILVQGLTTLIGVVLGARQVVVFNTTRTLINFSKQLVNIINFSFISEFSYAFGMKNRELLDRLYIRALQLNIAAAFGCLLFIILFAQWIFDIWTHGEVSVIMPFFILMIFAAFVNSLWHSGLVLLISANKQFNTGISYLVVSALALTSVALFLENGGLTLVGCMLIIFEILMLLIVYDQCKRFVAPPWLWILELKRQ